MITIVHECPDCRGTGLYQGFCEGPGEAVVCLSCEGQGFVTVKVKEFKGRKKIAGVKKVKVSAGRFIATGVGGVGNSMTYREFLEAYPENPPKGETCTQQ